MRFPVSGTGFHHDVDVRGLESRHFPNPLIPAAGSTLINLLGRTYHAKTLQDLPPLFSSSAVARDAAFEEGADSAALKPAVGARDIARIKTIWTPFLAALDERTLSLDR